jgi:hypothetical protein
MYKYFFREGHPLAYFLSQRFVPVRSTRRTDALYRYDMNPIRCRKVQYSRSYLRCVVELWNALDCSVFGGVCLYIFKSCAANRSPSPSIGFCLAFDFLFLLARCMCFFPLPPVDRLRVELYGTFLVLSHTAC